MSSEIIENIQNDEILEDIQDEETIVRKKCLSDMKHWVETEAMFNGRTDDDFLLMFLSGCKFNSEKAKKKMTLYYENRKKVPQWCANRNISELDRVIQQKVTILVESSEPHLPVLTIARYANYGSDASAFDMIMKLDMIVMEIGLRRISSQMNGSILLVDCSGLPMWVLTKFLNPTVLYNVVHCYLKSMPLRMKGFYVINFPFLGRLVWQLLKPLLSLKLRNRFHFYGSNWFSLNEQIDSRLLPEEYGGSNGSLAEHERAQDEALYSFSEYLREDDKFGFL